MRNPVLGGLLLALGVMQFWILMLIAEELYPGYNLNSNYISDLGVGKTALIFNSSIILLGIMVIASGILMSRRSFTPLLVVGGLGMMGVGLFPETTGTPHLVSALIAFLFSGLASFPAFRLTKTPVRYSYPVLGLISLASLFLFISHNYLGLGPGGMERMIVLPDIIWSISFGSSVVKNEA
ncbi:MULTISPECIES: DUF998 domain-containing protein [Metallosphaera]|uniref:DUF998 domain-containing protein n=1 Tax=Metallosphaera TaxID=41980 RepID=UPI001F059D64|nr:DUF998 domain-containing protein [Metallosphaera sedula]MCH1771754.1 DUF998 domain-containing protein [Metallosphaera sedula]MCP6728352.1 DUF998 domain-containing protein [Metallosphaera sedula]BBL46767.1 hypothetical protein MJ1HA_0867 [Metallosphaera sedula]